MKGKAGEVKVEGECETGLKREWTFMVRGRNGTAGQQKNAAGEVKKKREKETDIGESPN